MTYWPVSGERVPLVAWDEREPQRTSVNLVADLIAARKALDEAGITSSTIMVHPSDYNAVMELRDKCLSMDPIRGVACNLPLHHEGDHKSVGGYPWENQHFPRPRYEGASEADLAAIEEILGEPAADPYFLSTECDDCGAQPGEACNPDVEH